MKQQQVTRDGFRRELAAKLKIDPLTQASKVEGKKTLHFLAYFDDVIPYEFGLELAHSMKGSQYYTLLGGHYSCIIYLPFIANRSYMFFVKKLELTD